jgi:aminoglycoside phosphotransferase (APT) family kinase protein
MGEQADLTPRASQILRALGLPASSLEPVESYSNIVWLSGDYVMHYHTIGPVGRLEHEARVARRLAPEALYPEVIAVGRDGEHDWLVTRRVPGIALSAAWPWLTPDERRDAIHQAAAALRAVHRSPAQDLVPPCLLLGAPVLTRQALAAWLRTLGLPPAYDRLLEAVDVPSVMVHGDFHFNQILWYEGRVTALLDLEMSHVEAPDWDLGAFLTTCLDPATASPEDYRDAPVWLAEAYPEMFAYSSLVDRLALYAVVLRSAELRAAPRRCEEILDAACAWARAHEPLLPQ